DNVLGQLSTGKSTQARRDPVETGERREGIIDCRRESPDGYLYQLVDGEDRILHESAVRAGDVGLRERSLHLPRRTLGQDLGNWSCGDDEMSWTIVEANHGIDQAGDLGQLRIPDELKIATLGGLDDPSALLNHHEQLRWR